MKRFARFGNLCYRSAQHFQRRRFSSPPKEYVHFDKAKQRKGFWNRISPRQWLFIAPAAIGGFSYIYFTHLETVEATGRKRFVWFSKESEEKFGKSAQKQMLEQFKANVLPHNHAAVKYVKAVGERIVKANGLDKGEWSHVKWEWDVIHSKIPNAMVTPGGKVIVFSGILKLCNTEDDLAVVLAHEIGHTVARHAAEKMTKKGVIWSFGIGLWALTGDFTIPIISSQMYDLIWGLPNSREMETEADRIGIMMMTNACYDPNRAPVLFSKLPGQPPSQLAFKSTHPLPQDRVADLTKLSKTWNVKYEDHCVGKMEQFKRIPLPQKW